MIAAPLFAVALLGLASSGCYRHNFGPTATAPARPADVVKWNHYFVLGLIGQGHASPGLVCGGSPAHVQNRVGVVGWLVGAITAGIYVPTTTLVWCGNGRGTNATVHRNTP